MRLNKELSFLFTVAKNEGHEESDFIKYVVRHADLDKHLDYIGKLKLPNEMSKFIRLKALSDKIRELENQMEGITEDWSKYHKRRWKYLDDLEDFKSELDSSKLGKDKLLELFPIFKSSIEEDKC